MTDEEAHRSVRVSATEKGRAAKWGKEFQVLGGRRAAILRRSLKILLNLKKEGNLATCDHVDGPRRL